MLDGRESPRDPVENFHRLVTEWRQSQRPFAVATIIEVMGSASARAGSKALFDDAGRNVLGWVGGGCAERFIGEQVIESLEEKRTRIVLADLDDEIFGLGVACGGQMRVFIEPILPSETVSLPIGGRYEREMHTLLSQYGWRIDPDHKGTSPTTVEGLLSMLARAIAHKRDRSSKSMRELKDLPVRFTSSKFSMTKQATLIGRSRITEALARHFTLLGFDVRAIGPAIDANQYPTSVSCSCQTETDDVWEFRSGEVVVIASHTSRDPIIVAEALRQNVGHIAMVGSRKRALEVFQHLEWPEGRPVSEPLFIPAGLDIDARNPDEIALSIVAEVLERGGPR